MIKVDDIIEMRDGSKWRIINLDRAEIVCEGGTFMLEDVLGVHHEVGSPLQYNENTFHKTAKWIYNEVRNSVDCQEERKRLITEIETAFGEAAGRMELFDPTIRIIAAHKQNLIRKGTWE